MTRAAPDASTDAECPLDLSGFEPEAVIARWRAAFQWANGKDADPMEHERGWFCLYDEPDRAPIRYRRRQLAAMIWRLENTARATEAPIEPESPYDDHND